ncbi:hypothetical protein Tco_0332567 [Tanacetum coccineum]
MCSKCCWEMKWFMGRVKSWDDNDKMRGRGFASFMTVGFIKEGLLEFGEWLLLMRLDDGRTAQQSKIWTWQSELVLKDGSSFSSLLKKIVAHIVMFVFYCVVLPTTMMVPEVVVPQWGAVYIPLTITVPNAIGIPRLFKISNSVNEWVVTEKHGDASKFKGITKQLKKPWFKLGESEHTQLACISFLVVLVEAAETLEFALAAYSGRMVEYENLSPQQPPRTHTQESQPEQDSHWNKEERVLKLLRGWNPTREKQLVPKVDMDFVLFDHHMFFVFPMFSKRKKILSCSNEHERILILKKVKKPLYLQEVQLGDAAKLNDVLDCLDFHGEGILPPCRKIDQNHIRKPFKKETKSISQFFKG